ncbi:MAG: hypothetical protein QOF88_6032, partial [Mycobacterium sp.]|nr:hypothetical protein [Mycobacterium sp.]
MTVTTTPEGCTKDLVSKVSPLVRFRGVKPTTSCHQAAARSQSDTVKSICEIPISSGTPA